MTLQHHIKKWKGCILCPIGGLAKQHVFFRGSIPCHILFIGEAPGKTEDVVGKPFVGQAGKVFDFWMDEILKEHPKFRYGITNTISCRPTDGLGESNRQPNPIEIYNCSQRLQEIIEITKPYLIVTLGAVARNVLMGKRTIMVLPHPAFILRQGGIKSNASRATLEKLLVMVRDMGVI